MRYAEINIKRKTYDSLKQTLRLARATADSDVWDLTAGEIVKNDMTCPKNVFILRDLIELWQGTNRSRGSEIPLRVTSESIPRSCSSC